MSSTMTVRIDEEMKARLEKLAGATQRSKSFLAAQAIQEFIEINEWQIREVRAALKEATRGDFATDAEVASIARKWKANAR